MSEDKSEILDLLVIGGGINGCGIARDAAGRGLTVALAEMNDLASATSSASTKLFHGGLRYLEYFEINLVKHALAERDVLLKAMPHISWPMRFVLPYHKGMRFEGSTPTSRILNAIMPWMKGRRPAWLIRFGLMLYDTLGGRSILPGTKTLTLAGSQEGEPLDPKFKKAFEYSDCWIEDSRLVVLNARDAQARGADIMVRTKVVSARRVEDIWEVDLEDTASGHVVTRQARMLVNAGGPWVGDIIQQKVRVNSKEGVRLVRGSHIVTHKLFQHDKCYFFQGTDGRIIFAIPYESDFTLIGTTDAEHPDPSTQPECTPEERDYLIEFANNYFKQEISVEDVVWTYSGVRPLYDDGASSATAATRDYTLKVDDTGGAPILNVFGGKITTYRRLAEDALEKIAPYFPGTSGHWTAGVPLPGGDFGVNGVETLVLRLREDFEFLTHFCALRLVRAYGTEAWDVMAGAETPEELGRNFENGLFEREVLWLIKNEYARTAQDIVWRRNKLGLRMSVAEVAALDVFVKQQLQQGQNG
ncbi:MAG: glycerol-3-phosphate dehydrogenase [Roseobacter sp.]